MSRTYSAEQVTGFVTRLLGALGMSGPDARGMAEIVVSSDLAGHESCGLRALPGYVEVWRQGRVDPAGRPFVDLDRGSLLRVDGGRAFGHVTFRYVTDLVVERARQHGVCGVAVRRTHHLGRVADFCDLAARQGVVTLFFLNCSGGGQVVAPYGGTDGRLATNPVAFGIPRSDPDGPHLVLDMATSAVAAAALAESRDRGRPDPAEWVTATGALRPAGGAKGFGLALVAEALAGSLAEAGVVRPDPDSEEQGGFVLGVDVGRLRQLEEFAADVDRAIEHVRDVPLEDAARPVRSPGEASAATAADRAAHGIPVQDHTLRRLRDLAADLGIPALDP
jgi:uncharacterized oxidoreductase